jgi:hypothetical protein
MDNYRLDEIATRYDEPVDDTAIARETRMKEKVASLEERIIRLEERINLMMALKTNGLDITKFSFGIAPL